jgi:hypothetical protein
MHGLANVKFIWNIFTIPDNTFRFGQNSNLSTRDAIMPTEESPAFSARESLYARTHTHTHIHYSKVFQFTATNFDMQTVALCQGMTAYYWTLHSMHKIWTQRVQCGCKADFMRFDRNPKSIFFVYRTPIVTFRHFSAFRQVLETCVVTSATLCILMVNVKRTAVLDLSHDGGQIWQ